MGKFAIFKGHDEQFYWHLKAPNGEIICQSEGYVAKQGAQKGIAAVKEYASDAAVEDQTKDH